MSISKTKCQFDLDNKINSNKIDLYNEQVLRAESDSYNRINIAKESSTRSKNDSQILIDISKIDLENNNIINELNLKIYKLENKYKNIQKSINDLSKSTTTNISSSIPTFVDNNNSSRDIIDGDDSEIGSSKVHDDE